MASNAKSGQPLLLAGQSKTSPMQTTVREVFRSLSHPPSLALIAYLESRRITIRFLRDIDNFLERHSHILVRAPRFIAKFNGASPLDAYLYFMKGYLRPAPYVSDSMPWEDLKPYLPTLQWRMDRNNDPELTDFFKGQEFRHDICDNIDAEVNKVISEVSNSRGTGTAAQKLVKYALFGKPVDLYKFYEFNYQTDWMAHLRLPSHVVLEEVMWRDYRVKLDDSPAQGAHANAANHTTASSDLVHGKEQPVQTARNLLSEVNVERKRYSLLDENIPKQSSLIHRSIEDTGEANSRASVANGSMAEAQGDALRRLPMRSVSVNMNFTEPLALRQSVPREPQRPHGELARAIPTVNRRGQVAKASTNGAPHAWSAAGKTDFVTGSAASNVSQPAQCGVKIPGATSSPNLGAHRGAALAKAAATEPKRKTKRPKYKKSKNNSKANTESSGKADVKSKKKTLQFAQLRDAQKAMIVYLRVEQDVPNDPVHKRLRQKSDRHVINLLIVYCRGTGLMDSLQISYLQTKFTKRQQENDEESNPREDVLSICRQYVDTGLAV